MKLSHIRTLETALRRLEEGRERLRKVETDFPDPDLIRLGKLVVLDIGTLRGLIGRFNHGE